jgi:3-phenylpropionate/trans-cinnamate dioxygenase ferredoxin subunit
MAKHVVARLSEIPDGGRKLVTVKGRPIALFRQGEEFFAIANRCPHLGGPLIEGVRAALVTSSCPGRYETSRAGEIIRCPWHAWEFDLRTGRSVSDPARFAARRFPAEVAEARTLAVETFPVSVEDRVVVVEL